MGKSEHQKELLAAYKERKVLGGVCCVTCTQNQKRLILGAIELKSQRNRFELALATDSPMLPSMGGDWQEYGGAAFTFEVLEELEKRPDQSDRDFSADVKLLAEIWREKFSEEGATFYV